MHWILTAKNVPIFPLFYSFLLHVWNFSYQILLQNLTSKCSAKSSYYKHKLLKQLKFSFCEVTDSLLAHTTVKMTCGLKSLTYAVQTKTCLNTTIVDNLTIFFSVLANYLLWKCKCNIFLIANKLTTTTNLNP